jgi:UDP-2,3-diacylglucosamine pyrophosphatase LpxH
LHIGGRILRDLALMTNDAFQTIEDLREPGDTALLPAPDPSLVPPTPDEPLAESLYFDPERWDAEVATRPRPDGDDPVTVGRGRIEGRATAAVFLSDLHLSDGTAGGDDFLEAHLHAEPEFGGLFAGAFPAGESRALLVVSALTFAFQRLAACTGRTELPDVVLAGDVIDFLGTKGRGDSYVSRRHLPLFRALAALRGRAGVYWLRGNHDYVIPAGPWDSGEFYVNSGLRILAEHGDVWDETNWPPGPLSKGARLVLELGSAFAVRGSVSQDGRLHYLMSGLDNVRPLSDDAVNGFLDRRAKYSDVAAIAAALARLKFVGSADDSAAYRGAKKRRAGPEYADWLMVQGHTHVPAMVPNEYYNLGTWTSTLVGQRRQENQIEAFPFLLAYVGADGRRVEEFYVVRRDSEGMPAAAILQSRESVTALRKELGYKAVRS